MRRATLCLLLSLIVCGFSFHASATDGTAQAAALKQFEDGARFYEQGQFEKALLAFSGSLSLLPSPNTRLYVARCQRALGRTASAAVSYRLSAREANDRVSAGEMRFAATRQAANEEVAELAPRVPKVTLGVLDPALPGLTISIDGADVPAGAWDAELELDPGAHAVVALAQKHEAQRLELQLGEGERKRVEIVLLRRKSADLVLDFGSRPSGLSVLVNRRPLDVADASRGVVLAVGSHVVDVSAPGYVPFHWSGTLSDGETKRLIVTLRVSAVRRRGGTPPWALYSSLGLSLAALGTGSYFALSAKSDADAQRALDPLLRTVDAKDSIDERALFGNLAFGVGALALVGSGVLLLTTDFGGESGGQATITPLLTHQSAALSAEGTF